MPTTALGVGCPEGGRPTLLVPQAPDSRGAVATVGLRDRREGIPLSRDTNPGAANKEPLARTPTGDLAGRHFVEAASADKKTATAETAIVRPTKQTTQIHTFLQTCLLSRAFSGGRKR
jgi:hypothetical protein